MTQDTRLAELSLKIASQANLASSFSKKELAVVSPCSTCQNFTQSSSSSSDPFRSACPRRIWIQQQQNNPDDPSAVDPVLSLSGTDDPNKLANPVVDPTTGNYLIWVAAVEDNPGIADEQNNPITPGILDPNFNNLYIKCRLFPYTSDQHHDVLRATGAFQEMDHIVAEEHRVPPITTPLTNSKIQYINTPIAGTVSRTSIAYHFDTQNPDDHALVGGC